MHIPIFSKKDLKETEVKKLLEETQNLAQKKQLIENWNKAIISGKIHKSKEEKLQSEFLNLFFGDILEYEFHQEAIAWQLEHELKTQLDGKKPDGALGYFRLTDGKKHEEDVRVVIELKGPNVNLDRPQNRKDFKGSPVEQAFSYVPKMGGRNCRWVIVSNFLEIRLYHASDMGRYEYFYIPELFQNGNLGRFFFLLSNGRLFLEKQTSKVEALLENRQKEQKTISNVFYSEYKGLREILFNSLRKNNPSIPPLKLFSVSQKLIDRLIFICFVKDLELVGDVFRNLREMESFAFDRENNFVWKRLLELFRALDDGYSRQNIPPFNGGLFKKDELIESLIIDDSHIKPWIEFVSRYDFSSDLNVNILGHIFEQSISDIEEIKKEIELGKAIIEEPKSSTSKRKKDGVYYTPEYVTKYIVKKAVGGWLEERSKEILAQMGLYELPELKQQDYDTILEKPDKKLEYNEAIAQHLQYWEAYQKALGSIKVLDPACGSGAFLTQVFDYLSSEWKIMGEETRRLKTPLKSKASSSVFGFLVEDRREEWLIKKNIIVNNLFGVDLNAESVEITKLSLWLKTANKTESLASLVENIKQGNSLVSDSFIVAENAFDWEKEFSDILSSGGFDVVVGNPPYVRAELILEKGKYYLINNYEVGDNSLDLFGYFFEKGYKVLNKKGKLGFITNSFNKTSSAITLRSFLATKTTIREFIDFYGHPVFEGTTTYPVILLLDKRPPEPHHEIAYCKVPDDAEASEYIFSNDIDFSLVEQELLNAENWGFISDEKTALFEKIKTQNKTIFELHGKCYYGLKTSLNEAFITDKFKADDKHIVPIYEGKDISKWYTGRPSKNLILFKNKWTNDEILGTVSGEPKVDAKTLQEFNGIEKSKWQAIAEKWLAKNYKEIYSHLAEFKEAAIARYDQGQHWWEMRQCAYYELFAQPKIIFPNLQNRNKFSLDETGCYINAPAVFIPVDDKALLGILNSRLVWSFLHSICVARSGGYIEVKPQYFEQIPIANYIGTKTGDKIAKLVGTILNHQSSFGKETQSFLELLKANFTPKTISGKLNNWHELEFVDLLTEMEKGGAKIEAKKQKEWLELFKLEKEKCQTLQTTIREAEKEIDKLVYQLYGLTDPEIDLVKSVS